MRHVLGGSNSAFAYEHDFVGCFFTQPRHAEIGLKVARLRSLIQLFAPSSRARDRAPRGRAQLLSFSVSNSQNFFELVHCDSKSFKSPLHRRVGGSRIIELYPASRGCGIDGSFNWALRDAA